MKIRSPRRDREVDFIFTIHEKNRALVNMRSLLLEPSVQRVYHVVFANTLQDMNARLARKPPVANGVRIKVAARRSVCSLEFLKSSTNIGSSMT
jgi:hypothetical protein